LKRGQKQDFHVSALPPPVSTERTDGAGFKDIPRVWAAGGNAKASNGGRKTVNGILHAARKRPEKLKPMLRTVHMADCCGDFKA
jgi:hypothetical protein